MSNSTTERTTCTFSVREYASQKPWIMIETDRPGLKALGNGFIGLEMREDVPFAEAEKLAQMLRDKIAGITYTRLS